MDVKATFIYIMKFKSTHLPTGFRIALVIALLPVAQLAAQVAPTSPISKKADDDWTNVVALSKPVTVASPRGAKKTTTTLANERAQKAVVARQAAQAAKDFYTAYPTHVNAKDAKKIEALQSLLGVTDSDRIQEQSAIQTAALYRADKRNAADARFQVALLSERTQARSRMGGDVFGNDSAELRKIADKLRLEFGDIPTVFNFYLTIARGANMATAQSLATQITQWPAASTEAKTEAQTILARQSMVGQLLRWTLPELDQKDPLDLSQQSGRPTLIYVSFFDEEGVPFAGLANVKKLLPPATQVIYLSLGATAEQVRGLKASAPVQGHFCYEPRGSVGPAAEQLYVRQTPYVYMLGRTGALAGFGPLSELPNLLAANR